MDTEQRDEIVEEVTDIIESWVAYDNSGDFSGHVDTDTIAEEVVHVHPGKQPITGKEDFIEFFEGIDVSDRDWEATVDDVTVGRDIVVARTTFRGLTPDQAGEDPEESTTTSVDVFKRSSEGSLQHILSVPSPDG